MKHLFKLAFYIFCLNIIGVGLILAQTFPVSVSTRITPPYSIYLSDYTAPGTEKLIVSLFLNDKNEPFYDVRLGVIIKGAGIQIESKPDFNVSPINLQQGAFVKVAGADLAPYLAPENLIFKGITRQEYEKKGGLKEGIYEITFRAYDFRRTNVPVSNVSMVMAWMLLNDPPRINTPAANAQLKSSNPQNIAFNWLPMHKGSPNSAFTTEYVFQLFEIRVKDRNPNEVIRGAQPIYETVLSGSTFNYGPSEPFLTPGSQYAYRVQARDVEGRDLFKNNGYSEVAVFTYGEACRPPANVSAVVDKSGKVKIQWESVQGPDKYTVRYRAKDNPSSEWFEETVALKSANLSDLKDSIIYEYQVKGVCGSFGSNYTEPDTFYIPKANPKKYDVQCNSTTLPPPVLNMNSTLPSAMAGAFWDIGHFQMEVKSVSGSNGVFSGRGIIFVPFLGSRLVVSFQNIRVNGENRVVDGIVMADEMDYSKLSASTINDINNFKPKFKEICVIYDEEGYDKKGYTKEGYDREGYDREGFTKEGYDKKGYDKTGYNKEGYDQEGYNQEGYDQKGYNKEGYNEEGFNKEGYNAEGLDKKGLDKDGKPGSGTSLLNSLKGNDLDDLIAKSLKNIKNETEDSIIALKKEIKTLSATLDKLADELHLNKFPDELKGEGMSKNFSATPQIPENPTPEFTPKMLELANTHIKAYKKDAGLDNFNSKKKYLDSHPTTSELEPLKKAIEDKIKILPAEEAKKYKGSKDEFKKFIKSFIDKDITEKIKQNNNQGSIFSISDKLYASNGDLSKLYKDILYHQDELALIKTLVKDIPFAETGMKENFIIKNENYQQVPEDQFNTIRFSEETNNQFIPGPNLVDGVNKSYLLYKVISEGGRKRGLFGQDSVNLPVGIAKTMGNIEYIIAIDSVFFTPVSAHFNATMGMEIPMTGDWVAFKGVNIEMFPFGFGGTPNKLQLASDVSIRLNNNIRFTLKGTGKRTYIEWDCNGFKSLNIQGEFEFCPGLIQPLDSSKTTVKAYFETQVQEWGDFIAKVNIDPFKVKGLKDFGFHVEDAYVDFSDLNNPLNMVFPSEYQSAFSDGNSNLWQGFYLKHARVDLPKKFDSKKPRAIEADNLIIDSKGLSGIFSATGNIIPYSEGSLNGWAYSLDKLSINIQCNKIKGGGIAGTISIPILSPKDTLGYSAMISSDGDYSFSISLKKKLSISLWAATMDIKPSSFIEIREIDNKFVAQAVLDGSLSINAGLGKDEGGKEEGANESGGLIMGGLEFEGFTISSSKPYIRPGHWSLSSVGYSNKAMGFSLTLKDVGLVQRSETEVGIHFGLMINLAGEKFSGETEITILGTMGEESEDGTVKRQRWKYKTTELDYVKIDVVGGPINISGSLRIYRNDPVFGKGFKGTVEAEFGGIGIKVNAIAQFGKIKELDYWYVDAMVRFKKGIPLASTGMALYGFGGGAYHHMKQKNSDVVDLSQAKDNYDQESGYTGKSPSGIEYVPDPATQLGVKASVVFGMQPDPTPFNGDVTFEITFNHSGGINMIGFRGNGYFMAKATADGKQSAPQVYASVDIRFDFINSSLHGNAKAFVNVAGGVVRGRNPGNLAGEVVFHFDKKDWYIWVGKPSSRMGVIVAIGPLKVDCSSYLMIGTQIEPIPSPPAKVLEILKMKATPPRDPKLFSGKGFCFGSDISINTGKMQMLMFYAQFEAGIGFDVMLANWGENAICTETGKRIGINGWYAEGQAYAFFEGAIGIRVKVFKFNVDAEILKIGAAALLEAKLPNPFWMRGTVGGYYSILGGKVKGNCKFQVTIGSECTISGAKKGEDQSAVVNLNVISDMTPANQTTDVDVFAAPQAVFNLPVGEEFSLAEENDSRTSYKIVLDYFKVKNENNQELLGSLQWNSKNDVVAFNSFDILPGKKNLKVALKVHFEENKGGGWATVMADGAPAGESREYSFTTGAAPEYIPLSNVNYSYPAHQQLNFMKGEYGEGYIQLKRGQAYLFAPGSEWKQVGRATPVGQKQGVYFNFSYDASKATIVFNIPQNISNNKIYNIELVNVPASSAIEIDKNVTTETQSSDQGEGVSINVETRKVEGSLDILQEKVIYGSYFRTSIYNTLADKLNVLTISEGASWNIMTGVQELDAIIRGTELFDQYDILGTATTAPLVQFEAALGTNWYTNAIYPLVYEGYPIGGSINIKWRDPNVLGVIPAKAVFISQGKSDLVLSEEECNSGMLLPRTQEGVFRYKMPFYAYYDYYYMQQQAANSGIVSSRVTYLLSNPFTPIYPGSYPVKIKYVLPGINVNRSSKTINIKNP